MINRFKNSLKYGTKSILIVVSVLLTGYAAANYSTGPIFDNLLTSPLQDTTKPKTQKNDTIPGKDSTVTKTDTFQLKISSDSLDAQVDYEAADSVVLDVPNKRIILYSKGRVRQKDIDLSADSIELDQSKDMLTATFRRDSLGNMVGRPVLVQGGTTMESDVIRFNTKSQRGITNNTYTRQDEIHIHLGVSKKVGSDVYYASRGQLTTCNFDTPHFAFRTNKMKLVNKKVAITGPVHPEFEGVPVPIYLPFGMFPLSSGRHSGLLPPQFTASEDFGLGLEGLGYYKVLGDNFDVTLRTNIYSYGGWNVYLTPRYLKRYRYNGSLSLALQKTRILSDDPKTEFTESKTFNITWAHSTDSRARPGTSFSANVNAGSTKFNQFVANNPVRNFSNQLNSSISYSKTWGLANLALTANHNQNNNTGLINLSLPNMAFTLNTFYPLQKKTFTGQPKWYEKLGIGLNTNFANQISFYDSLFSISRILDTIQWGAQHNIPIQLSLPPLGPFTIGPGISYQEKWYSRRFERRWNDNTKKVDTIINKGFYTARDLSFSLGVSTAIFGMFDGFGKNSKLYAIRHVIRPTFSFNYRPDMAKKDYYSTQIDTTGREFRFSYYEGAIFGPFSEGEYGGIGFGIDNMIEGKIRSPKDTSEGGIKRFKIIDGFGFNGGYNFIADSFKLSPLNFYARSTLFEKINITAGATLDPYLTDTSGFRKDMYAWEGDKFSLGHITSGNVAVSATFQSPAKDPPEDKQVQIDDPNLPPLTLEEQMAQLQYVRQNPAEFVDFNIPWSLTISYSLNFSRVFRPDYSGYRTETNSNFNFNGDFSLTEKWKFGMTGFYDFKTAKVQTLTMFITREMHCWQLSINVTPVGLYRSFNITLNPKSGILRDMKVNRTRYFYGG